MNNKKIIVKNWCFVEGIYPYNRLCKNSMARRVHLCGTVYLPQSQLFTTVITDPVRFLIYDGDLKMFEVKTLNSTYYISLENIQKNYKNYFMSFLRSFKSLD